MKEIARPQAHKSTVGPFAKVLRQALIAKSRPIVWMMRLVGFSVGKGCVVQTMQLPWNQPSSLRIGARAQICAGACLNTGPAGIIEIGSGAAIGRYNSICAYGRVAVGDDSLLSDWIHISDAEHIDGIGISPVESGLKFKANVTIGHRCFVGRLSTILPGASLGDDCIVGAMSLVTGAIQAGSVIAGSPARVIRLV